MSCHYEPWMIRAILKSGRTPARFPNETNPAVARLRMTQALARAEIQKRKATFQANESNRIVRHR